MFQIFVLFAIALCSPIPMLRGSNAIITEQPTTQPTMQPTAMQYIPEVIPARVYGAGPVNRPITSSYGCRRKRDGCCGRWRTVCKFRPTTEPTTGTTVEETTGPTLVEPTFFDTLMEGMNDVFWTKKEKEE